MPSGMSSSQTCRNTRRRVGDRWKTCRSNLPVWGKSTGKLAGARETCRYGMNLLGKLKFVFLKLIGKCDTALGLIFGVVPEHQVKGIEGGIVMAFAKEALKESFPYKHLQFNWIGDFNPSMMKVLDQVGAKILKTHVTYRYLFDRDKPFERAKKVNV